MGHFLSVSYGNDALLFRAGKKLGKEEGYSATEAVREAKKQAAETGKLVTIEHVPETDSFVLRKTDHKLLGLFPDQQTIDEIFNDPYAMEPSISGCKEDVAIVSDQGNIFHIMHDLQAFPGDTKYFVADNDEIIKHKY